MYISRILGLFGLGFAISAGIFGLQNVRPHTEPLKPSFDVLFPHPTGQNGYEEFVKASDMAISNPVWIAYENGNYSESGPTLDRKRRTLADPIVLSTLATLRSGLKKPIHNPREATDLETLFTELRDFRGVARLLTVEMDVLFADGKTSRAIECLNDGLEFGRDVQVDTLTSGVVGLYIENTMLDAFARHLEQLSRKDCDSLIRITSNILGQPDPQRNLILAERDSCLRSLTSFRANASALLDKLDPGQNAMPTERLDYASVCRTVRSNPESGKEIFDQAAAILRTHFDGTIAELGHEVWDRQFPGPVERESAAAKLVYSLCPLSYSRVSDRFACVQARVQLLAIYASLVKYHATTGHLPNDLGTLKLGRIPVDPFTGTAIAYRHSGDNEFTIGSVGAFDPGTPKRPAIGARVPITVSYREASHHSQSKHKSAWIQRRPMTDGAVFAATVSGVDGRIFVISGRTTYDGGLTPANRIFDPKLESWSYGAPIPIPRTSAGAAVGPNGIIYVAGGHDGNRSSNVCDAYDPKMNKWSRLKSMPTARDAPQAVAATGPDRRVLIYVIGGRDRSKHPVNTDVVEAYDPAANAWTTMAHMPTARHAHVATVGPDGKIYVLGGTNETTASMNLVEIYDPILGSWSKGPPMPYRQECAAAAATPGPDGEVFVFGGWDALKRPVRTAAAFSPRTRRWRTLAPLSNARAAATAMVIPESDGLSAIFLIGGTGDDASGTLHPKPGCIETMVEKLIVRPSFRPLSDR